MVEQQPSLFIARRQREIVFHDQNDVNVAGSGLAGNVTAEDYKTIQFSSERRQPMNLFEQGSCSLALTHSVTELRLDFGQSCSV